MARAATRKGKRAKQAPRPPKRSGSVGGSAKAVEQQLFFGRLRRSAKPAFALLAVVFAGTFVFLGVGSGGGAGLLDVGHWFGGGGSGTSIKSLQNKVAENPRSAPAYLALGQALEQNGRTLAAIAAFKRYVRLRPRSFDGLSQLAALYERRSRAQQAQLQSASAQVSPVVDASQFQPGGKLGQALAAYPDPFTAMIQSQAASQQAQLLPQLQQTRRDALSAYQRIAALTPDEPGAVEQVAIAALEVCSVSPGSPCPELQTALLTFQSYLSKFPDATDAAQVRKEINALKKQLAANPAVASPVQR